ncbi:MAG: DUF2264 domain-containing protein [Lachnospiraceae bacterium]|nr:DUF2264 domain-containing protein [Lachnospiraceae bacterium]
MDDIRECFWETEDLSRNIRENPWICREDMVRGLLDLIRPLKPYYNPENSMLHIGDTAAHYGEASARMEGWARVLWGLGPLFATKDTNLSFALQEEIREWAGRYLEGLRNGTDPKSAGYWGDITDYDQKMVETAAISVSLSLAPDVLWEPLTAEEKDRVIAWLSQINAHGVHGNNWRFFRILANMTFARRGYPFDKEKLTDDFGIVEHCYVEDGWYFDGHSGQMDYYIPFAMHFYGLIWASLAPTLGEDVAGEAAPFFSEGYKEKLLSRARRFAIDFGTWFSEDGAEVPFGRSLTYRFAHSAFWSALLFAEEKMGTYTLTGEAKHLLLGNLRTWFSRPILDGDGILTIGYGYPNLIMSEKYNAPGSPYWSFKAFLLLALPDNSIAWTWEEKVFQIPEKTCLKAPHMLLCHDRIRGIDHVTMFPTGQHAGMEHGNCNAKYRKLVYSNRFGFSVQRGFGLEDGAFDNCFVISRRGEEDYRIPACSFYEAGEEWVHMKTSPMEGVEIETYMIPQGKGWHIRIHKVRTEFAIDTADGGFALSLEGPDTPYREEHFRTLAYQHPVITEGGCFLSADWGSVGAKSKTGETCFIRAFPNTNLMAPLTIIPYVRESLEKGEHTLIHAFYGSPTGDLVNLPDALILPEKFAGTFSGSLWENNR